MSSYVIGFDIGGSGLRCLLADVEAPEREPISAHAPLRAGAVAGSGGLGFEFDSQAILRAAARACRTCLEDPRVRPSQVVGVACTSMRMSTFVLGQSDDAPILASPNRDARAVGPGLRLAADHGLALHAVTGHWPFPIFSAARLLWLAESAPERFEDARHVLAANEWLAWWMSGECRSDPTQAGASGLFDVAARDWAWTWIDRLGLPGDLFPPLAEPGSQLGSLRSRAASLLGLAEGIPVAVGAADTQAALLGCAALSARDAAIVAGTTAPVQLVLDEPRVDPEARVWTEPHVLPGHWVLESNAGPLGDALTWWAALLHPDDPTPIRRMFAEAAEATEAAGGASGMASTLGAEIMNARERGLPFASLSFSPLATPQGLPARRALSRAIAEGAACALHGNLEQLRAISGFTPERVHLAGGLSRSPTFRRLLAEVTGRPLRVAARPEASACGAAACAAVAAGAFDDLRSAGVALAGTPRVEAADAERRAAGRDLYAAWDEERRMRAEIDRRSSSRSIPAILHTADTGAAGPTRARRLRIFASADLDADAVEALGELGELEYASFRDARRLLKGPTLVAALRGYDVFVTEIDIVDVDALEALPELRVVFSCRGDAVNVDARACSAFGIPLLNAPGRNADAVADLAVAFLLMLSRKLPEASAFLRASEHTAGDLGKMGQAFGSLRGHELWGRTIGLVGLGAVGRATARRLAGFGARLLVSDPFVDDERAALVGAHSVPLETLLAESDLVSLHAAVTEQTRNLIDARAIAHMKPGAVLVNTARAALVDESALTQALADGHLGAAALDVFSVEPPGSDHPLLALPQVVTTPHVAGNTYEVSAHQGRIAVAELGRLVRGERPLHARNPEVLDDFDWDAARRIPSREELAGLRDEPAPAVTDLQRDAGSTARPRT